MEHTIEFIANFSSTNSTSAKHEKIRGVHFDHSGHVVGTNSHVLFASKKPYQIEKSNKTYVSEEAKKGNYVESEIQFPDWRQVLPKKSARKITLEIPEWFSGLENIESKVTMVLDYSNSSKPFIKIANTTTETSLAFNAKYLSKFSGQSLSFLISSPEQPTVILSEKSKIDPHSKTLDQDILNEEWFYILMPIKLDDEDTSTSKVYL